MHVYTLSSLLAQQLATFSCRKLMWSLPIQDVESAKKVLAASAGGLSELSSELECRRRRRFKEGEGDEVTSDIFPRGFALRLTGVRPRLEGLV